MTRPEDLAPFVPWFISQRLCADPSAPSGPAEESSPAATLFADISGFTPLSERLATRGGEGVETLTQVLNAYFGRLIDVILAHGGDVLKFAGDALLACWKVPDGADLARVTQLAAQAGREIQATLHNVRAPGGERLSLRVGIGAGEIFEASLGGVFNRWELVVMGPSVNEATAASAQGSPETVVLGPAARALLGARAEGIVTPAGCLQLEVVRSPLEPQPLCPPRLPVEAVPALLSYIPAAIHRRLAARQSGWLAELRRLTVLFVNLPGLGHATPVPVAQAVMHALQRELYRYEGSVNKLSVDEKGVTLVAALGLPPLSHEDDELRGVLAALRMQAGLQQLGWPCSVGVSSGQVFCGTIGNQRRCEYTIIGDVVNLSARLMQAAHGGILCDATTHDAVGAQVGWETLPRVRIKGKSQPVAIFKPLRSSRPAGAPEAHPPMVGRDAEHERLGRRLRSLSAERRGGVVLIEGEAGIGKSRLVADLVETAGSLGLTTMVGAAEAIERSTPYYAWRPVFRQLLRLDRISADHAECRRQVLAELAFDPRLVELAPLLDVVLSLEFGDNATTTLMFGEVRIDRTNDLLVRLLLRRTAETPLQLILEDCHWLDSASWALARRVAQEVPGLLLIVVTRPLTPPVPREYPLLAAAADSERLTLTPLADTESLALVGERLGVGRLPAAVAELLCARAQGNPFFLEELAYALRDAGKICISNGNCTVDPDCDLSTLPFPETIQGVITSRIDRLAPQEQLTLKVASVIGRTFPFNILHDVCPIEEDRPHQSRQLENLLRQELVQTDAPPPEPVYSFKHVITQEVAYQLMPPAQRRSLHRSVGEWYERHHREDLSPFFPLLARHWANADDTVKALDYLEKSGRNALREYANEEAVAFFQQALALDSKDRETGRHGDRETESGATHSPVSLSPCLPVSVSDFRRACWQRQLAEAHYNLGDLGTSRRHFQIALELLGYPESRSGWRMLLGTLWEIARQVGHRLWPKRFFGTARHRSERVLEAARAYERLAQIHYLNNATVPTVHAAFRALNLSEVVGTSPELARNYANAAVVTGLLMMHGAAKAHARRAQTTAEAVAQPPCTAYVAFIRGVYWVTVGKWDRAEHDLTRATEIAERIGEGRRWSESAFTLANVLSRRGDFRRSAAVAREVHEVGRRRGVPQVQVWGLSWHLWCLLTLDATGPLRGEIEAELADCLAAHAAVPLADQILGNSLLALGRWRRNEPVLAHKTAETAWEIIEKTGQVSHYLLCAYAGLAEVYLGLWAANAGQPDVQREMKHRAARLCKVLEQFARMYPIGEAWARLVRGRHDWLHGRPARARRAWSKGLAAASRFHMPYEQGLCHEELGRQETNDPARQDHLARAREFFARVGISTWRG
jgi:class 3 adenylate cyclase/tetratricopeptide (TPR) repeat protein